LRRIGDVVMTTPAAALLRSFLPQAEITYLVETPFRRLVEGHPRLDRVLAVPAKQSRLEFLGLLRRIRKEGYDALLDFHGGPRASWITAFSGARHKVGYAIAGKSFLYDLRVPRRPEQGFLHSVQTHAALVRALGFEFPDASIPPLELPPARPEDIDNLDRLSRETGLAGSRYVALHIGAGNRFRDWGEENHAALAGGLLERPGLKVVLFGGGGDRARAEAILGRLGAAGRTADLSGRLNLIETRELIGRAVLFIGPDSGPMHIAASTATPLVALFGPTLPAHFSPWRAEDRTVILQSELDCRPCKQRDCVTGDYRCLGRITPADVLAAAARFLD
jgi:heptosyltransferase-1